VKSVDSRRFGGTSSKGVVVDLHARFEARRLKYITRTILVVGFAAAVCLFFVDRPRPENPLGYDPLQTKRYLHDLEVYGGTANVLAAEFREWFAGLWYGRNLAYTTAAITLLLVGAVRFAHFMREIPDEDEPGDAPSDRSAG